MILKKKHYPMLEVISCLLQTHNKEQYSNALERFKTIDKLSCGGDRNISIHLDSIRLRDEFDVSNRKIILFDDLITTGNSLAGSAKILKDAGASEVICVALGKTVQYY